jgi:hypothetical protein
MINKIGSDRTGASVLGPKKKSSGSDRISDQNTEQMWPRTTFSSTKLKFVTM